jgi:hypothetical protein
MAKIKERLAVSKQTTQRVQMEMFSIKELKEAVGKKQNPVEISNKNFSQRELRLL